MALNKLELRYDGVYINQKKEFNPLGTFKEQTIRKTLDFAYEMSFGDGGEHRNHRSGGTHVRKNGEIFANTFQGKLSEFAVYNQLYKDFVLEKPDLSTYGLGKWDDWDFVINGMKASIKSTKSFGNLLLLETKDWNDSAEYIPNLEKGTASYDIFILVRIEPYCEDLLKKIRALYSQTQSKRSLESLILSEKWKYDIPGFVTREEVKYAISNKHIIQQGQMLNGKTRMDADNYYIQSGDMLPIKDIKKVLKQAGENGE
jgi:hypothetical protein